MMKSLAILGVFTLLSGGASAQVAQVLERFSTQQTEAATYIQTHMGQSLYWRQNEAGTGEFSCIEDCLAFWTPVQAAADTARQGNWTAVQRPEGTWQWAYDGKPLYTYVLDTFQGARLGDGLARGQWRLLYERKFVPPGMLIQPTYLGYVLADHQGRTLYTQKVSDQSGSEYWTPLKGPWLALDQGEWTIHTVTSGVRQWFYKGQPLFTYDKDADPQDVHGHGLNNAWSAVILESAPGLPAWVTIQSVDLGLAYADQNGLTLYAPVDIAAIKAAQTCPEECMQKNWRPIMAKPDEKSVSNWIIVPNDDGELQWSYKGQLLYTHTRDEKPGDMKGNGIAVGYRIGDGWRIIPVDPGLRRSRT